MIELLVRGRFVPLAGATARRLGPNSYEVRVPDPQALRRVTRRGPEPHDWDGAVFFIDGHETQPGLGAGGSAGEVRVSCWVL